MKKLMNLNCFSEYVCIWFFLGALLWQQTIHGQHSFAW